jgi:DNA-binding helix-hairpin-helix protein with protein kinase domain
MPAPTPSKLFDSAGQSIEIASNPLGLGGEGSVHDVPSRPTFVAKIYNAPQTKERSEKLSTMAAMATADLTTFAAWPTATLHKKPGGPIAGILMPKVSGCKEIHHLYSVAQRKKDYPDADWGFLAFAARNCAIAFEAIHQHGHVVGDVNQKNVMVSNKAIVQFVDCDSFQVKGPLGRIFRCGVGVPEYTPPELQGLSFRDVDRSVDHDLFGLAVLIFHLLMMGRHPFSGVYNGPGEMPLEKAIQNGLFAYARDAQARKMGPPPNTLPIAMLDADLVTLFERAFIRTGRNGTVQRPRAGEWRSALDGLLKRLKTCQFDSKHLYPATAGSCPWCGMLGSAGVIFFLPGTVRGQDGPVDIGVIWVQITGIAFPERRYDRPGYSRGAMPVATLLPPTIPTPSPYPQLRSVPQGPIKPDFFLDTVGLVGMIVGLVLLPIAPPVGAFCLAGFGLLWIGLYSQRSRRWREAREQANIEIERATAYNTQMESAWRAENADWYREHLRRKTRLDDVQARLLELESRIQNQAAEEKSRFKEVGQILRRSKSQHDSAKLEYAKELSDLAKDSQKIQLERHLDCLLIRDAKLKAITTERIMSLGSFGIETALDVERLSRVKVPGIGPVLTTRLVEWRDTCIRSFRSQPGIPASLRTSVDQRHQGNLRKCETILANGPRQLREIVDRHEAEQRRLYTEIQSLVNKVERAAADMLVVLRPH